MLHFPNQYQLSQECRRCKDTGRTGGLRAPEANACTPRRTLATPLEVVDGEPSASSAATPAVPRTALRIWNSVMCAFHTLLAVITFVVGDADLMLQVWGASLTLNTDPDIDSFLALESRPVGQISYTGIVVLFFALSAIFHFGNGWVWHDFYVRRLADKHAPTRWAEYFFSASVMILCIGYPAGLQQQVEMFFAFSLIATTMLFGDLTERMNKPSPSADAWALPVSERLLPHLMGYIPQVAAWVGILVAFYGGSDGTDGAGPPEFVYYLVWTQAALFFSFGFVQLIVLLRPPSKYVQGEIMYQILSLVAKGTLGGILLANVLFLSRFECIIEDVAANNPDCATD